ncbi:hypothetical protein KKF34_13045 [Myxococcota bacterium]|nr:hypothetical protein [Myxococcota bacterium]MBU1381893.1 hypothetical protein [Myxococcota bacterium]MBU1497794.1 hypothetical protein [Myxococcota bacterium]
MKNIYSCLLIVMQLVIFVSCDNDPENNNINSFNNNTGVVYRMIFVSPASGEASVSAGSVTPLMIQIVDEEGSPVKNKRIDFMITGQAGGSSLETNSSVSGNQGIALANLRSGNTSSHFNIVCETEKAPDVFFDVTVSDEGTVDFNVSLNYSGNYSPEEIRSITTGIIFSETCPESISGTTISRIRNPEDLDEISIFEGLPVDIPFVIAGKLEGVDSKLLAWGCQEPDPETLISGNTVAFELELNDYSMNLESDYPVTYQITTSVYTDFLETYLEKWFDMGKCAHGMPSLFLDCLVSWLEGGLNCQRGIPNVLSEEIIAKRGTFNIDGCRGVYDSEGYYSLEYIFQNMADGIDEIQYSLVRTVDFMDVKPFQTIEINSLMSYSDLLLKNSIESFSFPRNTVEKWPVINSFKDTCGWELLQEYLTGELEISDTYMNCGLIYTIINVIHQEHLNLAGVSFYGDSIKNRILECVDEVYIGEPNENIAAFIHPSLTAFDIQRAMEAFQSRVNVEPIFFENGDVVFSGSYSFTDSDLNGKIEQISWNVDVDLFPQGY